MADTSHLERMGRELECPICLSLLNSAVSLTCNHVFCNSCLEKSMRSASDCPVCKVPYRRREIRPAPHMDNLVSIYKSMEVASGVNIFVTQTATSTKLSGEENQPKPHKICENVDNGKAPMEATDPENQKKRGRKGSKGSSKSGQKDCGSDFIKPSFPTKKRVQLPKHLPLESPTQHEKLEGKPDEITINEPQKSHPTPTDMHVVNKKGDPVFSPFFWLREEEDVEKSTQHTDDQVIPTPADAPCFSDLKDSDDEGPCKEKTCNLSDNADFIDSEMFEWTQRPCSPELCSSPGKMQVEDTEEQDWDEAEAEAEAASAIATTCLELSPKKREKDSNKKGSGKVNLSFLPSSSPLSKILHNRRGTRKSSIRGSQITRSCKSKRSKMTMCRGTRDYNELGNVTEQNMQEAVDTRKEASKMKVNNCINYDQNDCSEANIHERTTNSIATSSDGVEPMTIGDKTAPGDFPASLDESECTDGSNHRKKCRKVYKCNEKIIPQPKTARGRSKVRKLKTGKGEINNGQHNEALILPSSNQSPTFRNDKRASYSGKANEECEENCTKSIRQTKKVKFSDVSEKICEDNPQNLHEQDMMVRQIGNVGVHTLLSDNPSKVEKAVSTLSGVRLQKCGTLPNKIQCAFCHSAEETEASGILVHYLKGKLVTESQDGRSDIIHVHKNCTEWAPNVFFEEDNVINLETELSRSRRIKCCCCEIKGATLGCYEKSCRKSFHVTCAKLTPECRWDYQNFVMLCPLHASCQLPNEMSGSQSKLKRKSATERQSQIPQVTKKFESSTTLQWKCHRRTKNLILCCSALTEVEKETVSEFSKLSRVTISKSWDSSVTHVIASKDENGACRRTLKFLMGILEGKWILSVEWIKACMKSGEFVDEQHYEVGVDIHGIRDGPKLGRLRRINKQPKLFNGFKFFFMGDFDPSSKGYLHELVIAAGGKVLSRKPVAGDEAILPLRPSVPTTLIIYSTELPDKCKPSDRNLILNERQSNANSLAHSTGAVVASNSWIMNSIAGHKLQNLAD